MTNNKMGSHQILRAHCVSPGSEIFFNNDILWAFEVHLNQVYCTEIDLVCCNIYCCSVLNITFNVLNEIQ